MRRCGPRPCGGDGNEISLALFMAHHPDGVGLRVVLAVGGAYRTGQDRAKAWVALLALTFQFLIV
jgi:hypothetical protein